MDFNIGMFYSLEVGYNRETRQICRSQRRVNCDDILAILAKSIIFMDLQILPKTTYL